MSTTPFGVAVVPLVARTTASPSAPSTPPAMAARSPSSHRCVGRTLAITEAWTIGGSRGSKGNDRCTVAPEPLGARPGTASRRCRRGRPELPSRPMVRAVTRTMGVDACRDLGDRRPCPHASGRRRARRSRHRSRLQRGPRSLVEGSACPRRRARAAGRHELRERLQRRDQRHRRRARRTGPPRRLRPCRGRERQASRLPQLRRVRGSRLRPRGDLLMVAAPRRCGSDRRRLVLHGGSEAVRLRGPWRTVGLRVLRPRRHSRHARTCRPRN